MTATHYDDNDLTSMVLSAVESIVYKRDINYLHNNASGDYEDYVGVNETYATNENNHQFLEQNYSSRNNSGGALEEKDNNNYWALLAIVLVIGTACGNILVCLAIAWEKRLQNVTNYFLASLAITDLMVAILVMPLGIVTLFRGKHYIQSGKLFTRKFSSKWRNSWSHSKRKSFPLGLLENI
jgi:7 transmembrane receptor (rhodopsin family)